MTFGLHCVLLYAELVHGTYALYISNLGNRCALNTPVPTANSHRLTEQWELLDGFSSLWSFLLAESTEDRECLLKVKRLELSSALPLGDH